jgi:hypothetical protein
MGSQSWMRHLTCSQARCPAHALAPGTLSGPGIAPGETTDIIWQGNDNRSRGIV